MQRCDFLKLSMLALISVKLHVDEVSAQLMGIILDSWFADYHILASYPESSQCYQVVAQILSHVDVVGKLQKLMATSAEPKWLSMIYSLEY